MSDDNSPKRKSAPGGPEPKAKAARTVRADPRSMATRPKRPLSAYNFFFREERSKILAERKQVKKGAKKGEGNDDLFSMLGKTIAARWKAISEEDKAQYKQLAEEDLQRYRREKEAFQFGAVCGEPDRDTSDHNVAVGTTPVPSVGAASFGTGHAQMFQAAAGFPQDHVARMPNPASAFSMSQTGGVNTALDAALAEALSRQGAQPVLGQQGMGGLAGFAAQRAPFPSDRIPSSAAASARQSVLADSTLLESLNREGGASGRFDSAGLGALAASAGSRGGPTEGIDAALLDSLQRSGQLGSLARSRAGLGGLEQSANSIEQRLLQLNRLSNPDAAVLNSSLFGRLTRQDMRNPSSASVPPDAQSDPFLGSTDSALLEAAMNRRQLSAAVGGPGNRGLTAGPPLDHRTLNPTDTETNLQSFLRQNHSLDSLAHGRGPDPSTRGISSYQNPTSMTAIHNPTSDELLLQRFQEEEWLRNTLQSQQSTATLLRQQLLQQQQQQQQQASTRMDPGLLDLQRTMTLQRQQQANDFRQAEELLRQRQSTNPSLLQQQAAALQQQARNRQLQQLLGNLSDQNRDNQQGGGSLPGSGGSGGPSI